jgi:hypothetical protein
LLFTIPYSGVGGAGQADVGFRLFTLLFTAYSLPIYRLFTYLLCYSLFPTQVLAERAKLAEDFAAKNKSAASMEDEVDPGDKMDSQIRRLAELKGQTDASGFQVIAPACDWSSSSSEAYDWLIGCV